MRRYWTLGAAGLGLLSLVLVAGCSGPKRGPAPPPSAEATNNSKLLEPFLLKEKPQGGQTVQEVRDKAKDGDEVVFQGIVPPANVKPWSDTLAVFRLMAQEDLDDPKVKNEFDCDEGAT